MDFNFAQYENLFVQYAPIIVLVYLFLRKNDIFVTPAKFAEEHAALKAEFEKKIDDLDEKYATKEFVNELKEDIKEIKSQLSTLSNYLMTQK